MKKKILHLTFDMRIGGTEQVIKNLIEGRDKDSFEMSIFCLEKPIGPFGQMLIDRGVSVTAIQRKEGFDFSVIRQIRAHIKQHKIDILHCHQYTPWVYGTLAAISIGIRVIFTEHGRFYPDKTSWKRKVINPLLTLFTDKITVISKATRQALVDYEYIPEHKIEVIYNGIIPLKADPEKTKKLKLKLGIKESTRVLGTIARFDPIKNHSMMINAFEILLDQCPDTVLIMVGDGEERENIEKQIDDLSMHANVILTGYISEPESYLACMDIFLLSSLSEGTSMTLLEAMSLSKPCVVTKAGGNAEIIEHEVNGIVTENGDEIAFADGVNELLDNPGKRKSMARASFQRYQQYFTVSQMVEKYQQIYRPIG